MAKSAGTTPPVEPRSGLRLLLFVLAGVGAFAATTLVFAFVLRTLELAG